MVVAFIKCTDIVLHVAVWYKLSFVGNTVSSRRAIPDIEGLHAGGLDAMALSVVCLSRDIAVAIVHAIDD